MDPIIGSTDTSIYRNQNSSKETQDRKDTFKDFFTIFNDFLQSIKHEVTLSDGGGNDELSASRIRSGSGNDTIWSNGWSQTIHGGAGDDVINAMGGSQTIHGGAGNDVIESIGGGKKIHGGAGDDVINAIGGSQTIHGGVGNDVIESIGGGKKIHGGAGDDVINAIGGSQTIHGGVGNDTIYCKNSHADLHFNAGDGVDTITGGTLNNIVFGESLSPENATYELTNNNLTIKFEGSGDQVILKGWGMETSPHMQFFDGTTITGADIQNLMH